MGMHYNERIHSTECKIIIGRKKKRGKRLTPNTGAVMTCHREIRSQKSSELGPIKNRRGAIEMNRNVERAQLDIEKVGAVMRAIENTYLDFEVSPDEVERFNDAVTSFYALWDLVHQVEQDIDRLAKDLRIVDVVEAAARTRK